MHSCKRSYFSFIVAFYSTIFPEMRHKTCCILQKPYSYHYLFKIKTREVPPKNSGVIFWTYHILENIRLSDYTYNNGKKIRTLWHKRESNNFNIGIRSILFHLTLINFNSYPWLISMVFYLTMNNFNSLIFLTLINIHISD